MVRRERLTKRFGTTMAVFVAPSYFLREDGIDLARFFGRGGFAGNHENGLVARLSGRPTGPAQLLQLYPAAR